MPKERLVAERPDTREMSDSQLVDCLGEVRETMKKFEAEEKYYKEALKARASEEGGIFSGITYMVNIAPRARTGLDTGMIKEEMGEEWVAAHSKTTEYMVVNINRREE